LTAILDTSVIIRYLVDAPPALAEVSTAIIESDEELIVTPVAVAEVGFVLGSSLYHLPRTVIVDALIVLVRRENIRILRLEKALVLQALEFCRPSHRTSFADALIWAAARSSGTSVYTFDRRFPSDGIEVLQTPT
jgi:predicted nucleic acid-binding protein